MRDHLPLILRLAGAAQLSILIASALVPFRLNWKRDLASLPKLHSQMYWTYGGYIVMCIVAFGVGSLLLADDLAAGTVLARCVCGFVAVFWGVRVCLQPVFEVKPYLTAWWLITGYHTLTVLFAALTLAYGYAAFAPQ
jgi:alginate O-acetyltransferase complex protein AlgI